MLHQTLVRIHPFTPIQSLILWRGVTTHGASMRVEFGWGWLCTGRGGLEGGSGGEDGVDNKKRNPLQICYWGWQG